MNKTHTIKALTFQKKKTHTRLTLKSTVEDEQKDMLRRRKREKLLVYRNLEIVITVLFGQGQYRKEGFC